MNTKEWKEKWMLEHNHPQPEDTTIAIYKGVEPRKLRRKHDAYDTLKDLFYDIQQTSYYCDFTLESAYYSFEKYGKTEKAK